MRHESPNFMGSLLTLIHHSKISHLSTISNIWIEKKTARKGIPILVTYSFNQSNLTLSFITQDTSTSADTPSSEWFKEDPFADFDKKPASPSSTVFPTKRAWTVELDRQIQIYENFQLDSDYDHNPLSFCKKIKMILTDAPEIMGLFVFLRFLIYYCCN
jgi:hypothetical protein